MPDLPPPVTISEERTIGATWAWPSWWQLAVWISAAAVFTAIGVWLLHRWLNPRR